ncbi:MAG TPA: tyrosine-type recombinase/integrase [Thermodesulfobacteriota bacterium]|nr:tyrosine-type recombinase/integrase [Thermodesulfobacteriota bacterium]
MGVFKRWRESQDGSKTAYWYIRYWINGEEKKESIGKVGIVTKTVAQAKLEERKRQIRLGQLDMIGAKIPTLNEFAEEYIKHVRDVVKKRSWKRDELCLRHLKGFFGDKKLSEITPRDVDEYKELRLSDVAPATVNRELEVLRHLFNLAERWKKFFGKNPASQAGLLPLNNQIERILTPEEEESLLACSNPYLRVILICALNTGMRKMEILSLKWSNVDLDNNVITLEHTNTKSKKAKRVPINSVLKTLLLEQKVKTQKTGYVFLNSEGTPYIRQDSINRCFIDTLKRAKIEGLRFHDLRHTAATRMIELGISIVAVSKILGHADLKTTMRYAHPEDSLKDAVEKLGNFTLDRTQNRTHEELEK